MQEANVTNPTQLVAVIKNTAPLQIAELDFVKKKFIQNYNYCNPNKVGELMYHRQLINFKQLLGQSEYLRGCDPFSLYACFVTAAAQGYSLDPADNEVYMVPLKGKAVLWRQAAAHVKRLMNTNQILYADQAKIVFEGDEFEVRNGRVVNHVEKFSSETYLAAYIRFQLDEQGNDRFFIYRRSDWVSWKNKSNNTKQDNPWTTGPLGQPDPGFLRTKIIKHACNEKCWASGIAPLLLEGFERVEVDEIEEEKPPAQPVTTQQPPAATTTQSIPADDSFVKKENTGGSVKHDDDDF